MSSSTMAIQALITKLENKGIVLNNASVGQESNDPSTPWFIKLLAMGAGWLTAFFMTGVFALLFNGIFDNPMALTCCGVFAIGLAWFSFSGQPSDFREHLALAVSLVGQFLISFAIFEFATNASYKLSALTWLTFVLFHSFLLVVMPNSLHRHISAIAASASLGLLFSSLGWHSIYYATALTIIALLTLNEFKAWFKPKIMTPLVYGFALQFLLPIVFNSTLGELLNRNLDSHLWLLNLSTTLVLLVVTLVLCVRHKIDKPMCFAAAAAAIVVGLASIKLSGITAGCVILLLGQAHSNRKLLAIGVLSLLTQTSFYYYNLEATLLIKSLGLAILGISLLLTRWVMVKVNQQSQLQKGGLYE